MEPQNWGNIFEFWIYVHKEWFVLKCKDVNNIMWVLFRKLFWNTQNSGNLITEPFSKTGFLTEGLTDFQKYKF